MKGIAFHWEPPYKDVYSGMDPMGNAWSDLAQAFGLNIAVIAAAFPPPQTITESYTSLDDFHTAHAGESMVYADYKAEGEGAVAASLDVDWLIIGPSQGWGDTTPGAARWFYSPSPGGGWHCLHLAHLACASQ